MPSRAQQAPPTPDLRKIFTVLHNPQIYHCRSTRSQPLAKEKEILSSSIRGFTNVDIAKLVKSSCAHKRCYLRKRYLNLNSNTSCSRPSTLAPSSVAGEKRAERTAETAAESKSAYPLPETISTPETSPESDTVTSTVTAPSRPRRRADRGYLGSILPRATGGETILAHSRSSDRSLLTLSDPGFSEGSFF